MFHDVTTSNKMQKKKANLKIQAIFIMLLSNVSNFLKYKMFIE